MTSSGARPVVYGEVLFDRFEDGSSILGGAPFNVAWHLQGFGLQPLFVSRVGDDDAGREVRARMGEWGMDTRGLQSDPAHPTGAVQVALTNGQPSYTIVPEQAYDFIDASEARRTLADIRTGLLYHGTLAARAPVSRDTLFTCIEAAAAPVFVDINLRAPWWQRALLERAVGSARWLKLNHEELAAIENHSAVADAQLLQRAERFRGDHELALLMVTQGEQGAAFVTPEQVIQDRSAPVRQLVDTVGAGDAFASVCIVGLMQDWPAAVTLRRALDFAARICEIRGATIADPDLYQAQKDNWNHAESAR